MVQQSGGGQNIQYGEEPGNYEEKVAVIVQDDGQPIGYEVRETEQYDTADGGHVTVEEDYQVVYGQGDSEEIQYTHIETYETKPAAIITTTTVTNNLPSGFEEGGIRYSSSSSGSGYRNSYEVDSYATAGGISSGTPAYEYTYKPAASLTSTLAGSYGQYATSPSSGLGTSGTLGYTGLGESSNYTSSSLKFSGTSPASGLPSYTNYQPNYNPPTVSPVTTGSGYDYSSGYRAEPTSAYRVDDTLGTGTKYDYLSGTTGGYSAQTSGAYEFTSGSSKYGTTDYTSGLAGNYTSGESSAFTRTGGLSPTYDYLSRELNSGTSYTSTVGLAGTSLAGNYASSTVTGVIPSYDSLRSNLISTQVAAAPQYTSQTTIESVPLASGNAIITTTTEEYTSGGAFGRSEYTSYSSQIAATGEGYRDYGF